MRLLLSALLVAMLLAVPGAPAAAQSMAGGPHKGDWPDCSSYTILETTIPACTRIIESGKESEQWLARAYQERARAYWIKRQFERAAADYKEVLKLEPSNAEIKGLLARLEGQQHAKTNGATTGQAGKPKPSAPAVAQTNAAEISFWESVRDSKSTNELEAYLQAYPEGKFAPLARIRIETLKTGKPAAKPDKTAPLEESDIHDCDRLAAQEGNPDNPGPFIHYASIDPDRAVPACRAAVEVFPDTARFQFQLARALQVAKKFDEALPLYRALADAEYPPGLNGLAVLYDRGLGVPKNPDRASDLFRKAVNLGNDFALSNLGAMYLRGQGVTKDEERGRQIQLTAAKKGMSLAYLRLGLIHANGVGTAKDETEAIRWFRKAIEKGEPYSMYNLARAYEDGNGVEQDSAEAVRLYRQAAESGHRGSMAKLGALYEYGTRVKQDDAEAVKWYRKAADKGHANAMFNLGILIENGRGTPKNKEEAIGWFRKAAKNGDETAALRLRNLNEPVDASSQPNKQQAKESKTGSGTPGSAAPEKLPEIKPF